MCNLSLGIKVLLSELISKYSNYIIYCSCFYTSAKGFDRMDRSKEKDFVIIFD